MAKKLAPGYLIIICLFFITSAFFSETCYGQILDVFVIGQHMKGDNTTGMGKHVALSDNTAGGFGAGINVEKFNLNMDLIFGSTVVKIDNTQFDSKLFLFDANLDYSLFKYAVTPMVTAGIGSVTFSDSFVQVENLSETDFSYNVGVGLRCTFAGTYLLKGFYRATWTTIKETDNAIMFNGMSVYLGYIF